MKKVPNSAFAIARLPAEATMKDIMRELIQNRPFEVSVKKNGRDEKVKVKTSMEYDSEIKEWVLTPEAEKIIEEIKNSEGN